MQFIWEGQPIADIEAWAAERGEAMIDYKRTIKETMPLGQIIERVEFGRMPKTFWDRLCVMSFPGRSEKWEEVAIGK